MFEKSQTKKFKDIVFSTFLIKSLKKILFNAKDRLFLKRLWLRYEVGQGKLRRWLERLIFVENYQKVIFIQSLNWREVEEK